ncbi:MAG TPA: hypothetical protein VH413_17810 [Verrucomicrobiae bacterium]|jgi:hypothetical protein|nr:hypothetical protein [Verrucomicrobiae bacterium]
MSAVSETIVREFFELNGFLVRQQRKYIAPQRREDDEIDFFVLNPQPRDREVPLPFILATQDLPGVERAVVVVKGWHTETFSPAVLANAPEIFRFVEPGSFKRAAESFGDDGSLTKILIVPALPQGEEARAQSIELLRAKGIDAIILFHTILGDLIQQTESNRNYQKSDLLQTIRVLKNYDFFREPQMELFKPRRTRKAKKSA